MYPQEIGYRGMSSEVIYKQQSHLPNHRTGFAGSCTVQLRLSRSKSTSRNEAFEIKEKIRCFDSVEHQVQRNESFEELFPSFVVSWLMSVL
jgi:hypothetical protein